MVRSKKPKVKSSSKVSDFKHVKAKVGRKAPRAINSTDTSFSSKSVVIREQSIAQDKGDLLSRRGHTVVELLSLINHHNPVQRRDALQGLSEILEIDPSRRRVRIHLPSIVQGTVHAVHDSETQVRRAYVTLIHDLLRSPSTTNGIVVVDAHHLWFTTFVSLAINHCCVALASLHAGIRTDAVKALGPIIRLFPDQVAGYGPRLLQLYTLALNASMQQPTSANRASRVTADSLPPWAVIADSLSHLLQVLTPAETSVQQRDSTRSDAERTSVLSWPWAPHVAAVGLLNVANNSNTFGLSLTNSNGGNDTDSAATAFSLSQSATSSSNAASQDKNQLMTSLIASALKVWTHVCNAQLSDASKRSRVAAKAESAAHKSVHLTTLARLLQATVNFCLANNRHTGADGDSIAAAVVKERWLLEHAITPLSAEVNGKFPVPASAGSGSDIANRFLANVHLCQTAILLSSFSLHMKNENDDENADIVNDRAKDNNRTECQNLLRVAASWIASEVAKPSWRVIDTVGNDVGSSSIAAIAASAKSSLGSSDQEGPSNRVSQETVAASSTAVLHGLILGMLPLVHRKTCAVLVGAFAESFRANVVAPTAQCASGSHVNQSTADDIDAALGTLRCLMENEESRSVIDPALVAEWIEFMPRVVWQLASSANVQTNAVSGAAMCSANRVLQLVEIALEIMFQAARQCPVVGVEIDEDEDEEEDRRSNKDDDEDGMDVDDEDEKSEEIGMIAAAQFSFSEVNWDKVAKVLIPMLYVRVKSKPATLTPTGVFGPFCTLPTNLQLRVLDVMGVLPTRTVLPRQLVRALIFVLMRCSSLSACAVICGSSCGAGIVSSTNRQASHQVVLRICDVLLVPVARWSADLVDADNDGALANVLSFVLTLASADDAIGDLAPCHQNHKQDEEEEEEEDRCPQCVCPTSGVRANMCSKQFMEERQYVLGIARDRVLRAISALSARGCPVSELLSAATHQHICEQLLVFEEGKTAHKQESIMCSVAVGKWKTAPSSPSEHVLDLIRACSVMTQSSELAYVSPTLLSESASMALAHLLLVAGDAQLDRQSQELQNGSVTRVQSALAACVRFLRGFPIYVDHVLEQLGVLIETRIRGGGNARTGVVALYGCAELLIHPGLRGVWDSRHRYAVSSILGLAGGVVADASSNGIDSSNQVTVAHQRQAVARLHACAPVSWGLAAAAM